MTTVDHRRPIVVRSRSTSSTTELPRVPKPPVSQEERAARRQKMAEYVKAGHSIEQAADKFGVTINTIRIACRGAGVVIESAKRGRKPSRDRQFKIIAELLAGESQSAIAAKHGVSRQAIHNIHVAAEAAGIFKAAAKRKA